MSSGEGPELVRAVVLEADEESRTVFRAGARSVASYVAPFPRPRADRVRPGHLVALCGVAQRPSVVWRWFDAVVLGATADGVRLWEPLHGEITARPQDPHAVLPPGSRALCPRGLPGADWWLAGPVGGPPEQARAELAEVRRFLLELGLRDVL